MCKTPNPKRNNKITLGNSRVVLPVFRSFVVSWISVKFVNGDDGVAFNLRKTIVSHTRDVVLKQ